MMRCLDWCTSQEYLQEIFIWLLDYSQMKVILFLVEKC